ncbi:hypothetical protein EMPS_01522 [Entomortierella parvispora]|uniref:Uncharacterized protein n=1 Tax=Entomortierella parvispora TaxID=205924 RepID=A0A9P3LSM7_9FUNG|nr:hypothetical protein EMPS_01522 [Entomortierella parvispora]
MSTTAHHPPAAGGSSSFHLHSSANTRQDHPNSRNSHYGLGHPSHSDMDGADGYHSERSFGAIHNDARGDTYVRGQYTQRQSDYEYRGGATWIHGASWADDMSGDESFLGHSSTKTPATSFENTPRRLLNGHENLAAYNKTAENGPSSAGPIPAYQGSKRRGTETMTKGSLQRKPGQSCGLADSMAGTLLSLTVVRTFREMTTQTTEDDMNGDTVWNGVRISCVPSIDSTPTTAISSAVETEDWHSSSTFLPSLPLETGPPYTDVPVVDRGRSTPLIQVQQSSHPSSVAQSLVDPARSLSRTSDSSTHSKIAVPEQTLSSQQHKREVEGQQGNKQQFIQEREKGKDEEGTSSASEPEAFTSSKSADSLPSTTYTTSAPSISTSTPKVAEMDPWTSAATITVPTAPKVIDSDSLTSTATIAVPITPKVTDADPRISATAATASPTAVPKVTEADPWTSTGVITIPTTTKVAEADPWTSTGVITVPTTTKVAEADPWTSTGVITVPTTTKVVDVDPWTSTGTITVPTAPKVVEVDPGTSTATVAVPTAPKVVDIELQTSATTPAATPTAMPTAAEAVPWATATSAATTTMSKSAEVDPWTSTEPIVITATTSTALKLSESDSKSLSKTTLTTSATTPATTAATTTTTAPVFSWTATETSKGAGALVDWSTGQVAEFPAEVKPKLMPITQRWETSYGAELEEGGAPERNAQQQWQDKNPSISKEDPWMSNNTSESRGRERDRGSTRQQNVDRGTHEQGGFEDQQSDRKEDSSGPHQHNDSQEGQKKKSSTRSTSVSSNSSSSTNSSSRASNHQSTQFGSQHQQQQRSMQSGSSADHRGAHQGRKPLTSAERFEQSLMHNNYAESQYPDGVGNTGNAYRTGAPQSDPNHTFNSYGQNNKSGGYGLNNNPDLSRPFADTQYGRSGYHNTGPGGRGSGPHNRYNPQQQQPYIQRQYGSNNTSHPTFQQQQPYYQQHQQYQAAFQHNQYSQSRQQPRPGYGYNNRPQGNANKNAGRSTASHIGGNQYANPNVVTVSVPEGSDFTATTAAVLSQTSALGQAQSAGTVSLTSDYTQSSRSSSPEDGFRNQRSASVSSAVSGKDFGAGSGSVYQNVSTTADTHTGPEKGTKLATSNDFFSFLEATKAFVPSTSAAGSTGHKGKKKPETDKENTRGAEANSVQLNSGGRNAEFQDKKNGSISETPIVPSLISIADDEAISGSPGSSSSTSNVRRDL